VINIKAKWPKFFKSASVRNIDSSAKETAETENSKDQRAQEDWRKREGRFRTIYEFAPVMIDSFDENGKCVMWNNECARQLGYTKEEVMAHPDPLSLFYPEPPYKEQVLRTILQKDGQFREYSVRAKDGSVHYQMWANFSLPDESIIAIGYDITERKKSEQEMLIQKIHFERLFNSAPEAILLHDNDDRVVNVNDEFVRLFGYSRKEAIGKLVNDLVAPSDFLEEGLNQFEDDSDE